MHRASACVIAASGLIRLLACCLMEQYFIVLFLLN